MPSSSHAFSTPRWAIPRAAPPVPTNATVGFCIGFPSPYCDRHPADSNFRVTRRVSSHAGDDAERLLVGHELQAIVRHRVLPDVPGFRRDLVAGAVRVIDLDQVLPALLDPSIPDLVTDGLGLRELVLQVRLQARVIEVVGCVRVA